VCNQLKALSLQCSVTVRVRIRNMQFKVMEHYWSFSWGLSVSLQSAVYLQDAIIGIHVSCRPNLEFCRFYRTLYSRCISGLLYFSILFVVLTTLALFRCICQNNIRKETERFEVPPAVLLRIQIFWDLCCVISLVVTCVVIPSQRQIWRTDVTKRLGALCY